MTEMSIPWESPMWDGEVSFALGIPSSGWVQLAILCNAFNQHEIIYCSDVFDPFGDLLKWLRDWEEGVLPASIEIDEEGYKSKLTVSTNTIGDQNAEFSVDGFSGTIDENDRLSYKHHERSIHCRVNRQAIVLRLATMIVRWLKHDYLSEEYGMRGPDAEDYGFDLAKLYLSSFQALARNR